MSAPIPPEAPANIARLERIMQRLRADDGCPWDREQTLETLKHYLIEETYEVLEAMDTPALHCEELGDLLLQIVFQAQIRREEGAFNLQDVIDSICDKMERRHPHVFGDESAEDADNVAARWEELKAQEGKGGIENVSHALPALILAEKIGKKAAKAGFDWQDDEGPVNKLEEEIVELKEAISEACPKAIHDELGDVLFAAVNVARRHRIRPEFALRDTIGRFLNRYSYMERNLAQTGRKIEQASDEELDALWEEAKANPIT